MIQSNPQDNLSEVTYRDLKGVVQDAPDRNDLLPAVYLFGARETPGFFSRQAGWAERLTAFVDEREPTVNWFFVHDGKPDGAGYFAAYERTSNRRVGFIGMSGFRKGPVPAADWIPVRGEPTSSAPVSIYSRQAWVLRPAGGDVPPRLVYLPSGSQLRQVDLAARTVTTVFETPEPIESVGIPTLAYWSTGHSTTEQPILVRTTRQIHELDQQHHVKRVFSLPADVDRRSSVEWYQIKSGQAIAVIDPLRSTGQPDNVYRKLVYRITGDGAIEDQFAVDLQIRIERPRRSDASLPAGSRAAGTGDLICDRPLTCDRERSATELPRGRHGPAERFMAQFFDRGPRSVNRPGHPGPAEKSCVRPYPARANRLVGLCAPFRSAGLRGLSATSPLADPAAVSELPRSGSPRPCGVRGVRNALSGSCPERNRDLRLKRWWRTHGE